jgi:trigger factor
MDVKKVFTDDVVRSLMETSRPEAEKRLRRSLALQALANAEQVAVSDEDITARAEELRQELGRRSDIDEARLLQAVSDELLQDKLLSWLEANATISEKTPTDSAVADGDAAKAQAPEGDTQGSKPKKAAKAEASKPKESATAEKKAAGEADG